MRIGFGLALLAVAALFVGRSAWAKGEKPPPQKPTPSAAPKTLPAGCERLADGRDYALSHDGTRLAFARWAPGKEVDYHGDAIPKSTVFVRTLATKKDVSVKGAKGVPVGWTTAGGLCLSSGVVVDPATGKQVTGTASMPSGADAEANAWTRDGSRLAYAAVWNAAVLPTPGVPQHLAEVDAAGKSRLFDFGDMVYPGEGGTLAWSADGKRLAFNIPFFEMGQVPPRRTGFIDAAAEPTIENVVEISQDNGIPGMHEARRPMRAHPGTTGPVLGGCVWNQAGTQLVYVHGGGSGNADVYLYDVLSQDRRRQTTDGATKWSPAIDAAGRRVAFLTGKVEDWSVRSPRQMTLVPKTLRVSDARLRIVDVLTSDMKEYVVPGEPAYPGNLTWSPDGSRVLFEIHGGNAEGTYAQAVPPAGPAPAGAGADATPQDVPVDDGGELIAALRSGEPKRVEVACERTSVTWTPGILAAMREVLLQWIPAKDYRPARAILDALRDHEAREALPEIRAALKSPVGMTVSGAIAAIVEFEAKDAVPDLDAVRTKFAEAPVRVHAAAAMVRLGDDRGWPDLEAGAKHKDADTRDAVCSSLSRIPTTRSVTILLPLVADKGFLYTTTGGHHVVGDHAALALARLTGVFFHRDVAKWNAWWKDVAKESIPASPNSATALADYEKWMDEREEAYQKEMREKLGPLVPKGK